MRQKLFHIRTRIVHIWDFRPLLILALLAAVLGLGCDEPKDEESAAPAIGRDVQRIPEEDRDGGEIAQDEEEPPAQPEENAEPTRAAPVSGDVETQLAGAPNQGPGQGVQGAGVEAQGVQAPAFTLVDHEGKEHSLSDYQDRIVVLEWVNPECPFVQRHHREGTMKTLANDFAAQVVWLGINSTSHHDRQRNGQFAREYELEYPILDDHTGEVGQKYGAQATPHMFVIDGNGWIVYDGAIDSDPSGRAPDDEVQNYVRQVLTALTNNQPVPVRETKPYGCSVKYAQ